MQWLGVLYYVFIVLNTFGKLYQINCLFFEYSNVLVVVLTLTILIVVIPGLNGSRDRYFQIRSTNLCAKPIWMCIVVSSYHRPALGWAGEDLWGSSDVRWITGPAPGKAPVLNIISLITPPSGEAINPGHLTLVNTHISSKWETVQCTIQSDGLGPPPILLLRSSLQKTNKWLSCIFASPTDRSGFI